jgi:hypothetical protein
MRDLVLQCHPQPPAESGGAALIPSLRSQAAQPTPSSPQFGPFSTPIRAIKLTAPLYAPPSPSQRHQTSSQPSQTLARAAKLGFRLLVISPLLFSSVVRPLGILFLPMQLPHRTEAVVAIFTRVGELSSPPTMASTARVFPGHENGTGEIAFAPASSPCFRWVKPWSLGPFSIAPASSVAARNGGPSWRSSSPGGRAAPPPSSILDRSSWIRQS